MRLNLSGQYHEVNPGQYTLDDEDIEVDVNNRYLQTDLNTSKIYFEIIIRLPPPVIVKIIVTSRDNESRIYNVRANAGDFIIGEAGRIDINSGQTLEVNYEEDF